MYSILKIGCFIKGCCGSYFGIPVQLVESIISLILYLYILKNLNKLNKNKIIGISFMCFGLSRFLLSFIRDYNNYFSFIFVEIFCLAIIIIGLRSLLVKGSNHLKLLKINNSCKFY